MILAYSSIEKRDLFISALCALSGNHNFEVVLDTLRDAIPELYKAGTLDSKDMSSVLLCRGRAEALKEIITSADNAKAERKEISDTKENKGKGGMI